MNKSKILNNKRMPKCGAVVVAAGSGKRMGSEINKVFLEIDGTPILAHTVNSIENSNLIDEIVLVTRECDISECYRIIQDFGLNKVKTIINGGTERQDSVLNGINSLSDDIEFVAIHDGARPFVNPSLIEDVITTAFSYQAAILAVPSKDTVKIVDDLDYISNTPLRNNVWLAQTPQVFEFSLIKRAFEFINSNNIAVTDDCQMVELLGEKVKIVMGSYDNIKITTPKDLLLAETVLDKG